MAGPTLSTKVSLDGEREYKQAISEINSGLKVLGSEMKLVTTLFADNADSVEALTAKGDVLERQILSQKEKIETLKQALENSADAFGESDKRTDAWKVSLNNAEAQLVSMERELEKNKEALQDAAKAAEQAGDAYDESGEKLDENGESAKKNSTLLEKLQSVFKTNEGEAKSFGEVAGDLAGSLGINLPDGALKAIDALGQFGGKAAGVVGIIVAITTAVVKAEQALMDLTKESAAAATELKNTAETVNINIEAAQQWDYVLKTVGSSLQDAQGDLSQLQEKMYDASQGTGEAAELFEKLGVSVVDSGGKLRSTEDVLLNVILALQRMSDESERNAVASMLLGGTGEKLVPIYNQNAESLGKLLDKKKELGVTTEEEVAAMSAVTQSLIDYEERMKSAKDTISAEFAPALAAFYDQTGTYIGKLGESAEKSGLVNFFGSLMELVTALSPLLDILGSAMEKLEGDFMILSTAVSIVADALRIVLELCASIANLLTGDFEDAWQNLVNISDMFSSLEGSATGRTLKNAFNASGDYNFRGGLTMVGENGPELAYLPQGSRIYNAQESRSMGGGDVFYITIDAKSVKEFNDIVRLAKSKQRIDRMRGNEDVFD